MAGRGRCGWPSSRLSPKRVETVQSEDSQRAASRDSRGISVCRRSGVTVRSQRLSGPASLLPEVLPMRRVHVSIFAVGFLAAALVAGRPLPAAAQTGFVPYFGKNNIHYDKFEWKTYETEHFTIYFYPEIEQ